MSPLTIGSLFAGIGGFDLAAEAMGWDTRWFVERDRHCQHWLAEHFPGRPIYGDITQVDFTEVEPVDVLCGGFPCQPSSAAGKRLGTADDRWLWPHFARAIGTLRPRYVVAENVPGLLSVNGGRAFAEVLRDLARLGYDARWDRLSAADVGAPHSRERIWIVAYAAIGDGARVPGVLGADAEGQGDEGHEPAHGVSELGHAASGGRRAREGLSVQRARGGRASVGHSASARLGAGRSDESWTVRDGARRAEPERRSGEVGNANRGRCCELGEQERAGLESARWRIAHGSRLVVRPWADAVAVRGADGTARLIPREAAEAGPESPLWPLVDGIPGRVARLLAIGNAVVPQCVVEGPFRVIQALESSRVPLASAPGVSPQEGR